MASKSAALPANWDRGSVFSHRAFLFFRKLVDDSSDLNCSTEFWSRGARPPLGEAMVSSTPAAVRTS